MEQKATHQYLLISAVCLHWRGASSREQLEQGEQLGGEGLPASGPISHGMLMTYGRPASARPLPPSPDPALSSYPVSEQLKSAQSAKSRGEPQDW